MIVIVVGGFWGSVIIEVFLSNWSLHFFLHSLNRGPFAL